MRSLLLLLPALFLGSPEATITEISLQRSPCFGTCPIDKVVLRSDGTARYTGTRFVERLGDYSGKIGVDEFKRLAKLIDDTSFVTFKDRYSRPITDHATITTTVTRGKHRKEVSNYANAGPAELDEIEKAVLKVMGMIAWEKAG